MPNDMFDPSDGGAALIGPDDPPPFERLNDESTLPLVLFCDHAGDKVPATLDGLGLDSAVFKLHIAFDIGAAEVTRRLSARLGATAVLAGYSRLVIDCNRQPGDPTAIPEISDNIPIPANTGLDESAKVARTEQFFWPYHHAVSNAIDHLWRLGTPPALLSVHSFTPSLNGQDREWDVGVLWNRDPRLADRFLFKLAEHPGRLRVGDNEPYSGKEIAYSLNLHGGAAGLPHCAVEIRQDLVDTDEGCGRWAGILADVLADCIGDPYLHQVRPF
jgi:predicted N-formylglutamate amidohydrolase